MVTSNEAVEFLKQYGYENVSEDVVRNIFALSAENKTKIYNVLRHHPNWDEEQRAVVFASDIQTGIDVKAIYTFVVWVTDNYCQLWRKENDNVAIHESQILAIYDKLSGYKSAALSLSRLNDVMLRDSIGLTATLGNLTSADCHRIADIYNQKYSDIMDKFESYGPWYYPKEVNQRRDDVSSVFGYLPNISSALADDAFVDKVNAVFPEVKAVAGQKVSRIVNKIGHILGLDKIKDEREIRRNGEIVIKDFGWNYQFAAFADAINPISIKQYTVISINPMDYWTMSFGKNWASCHTIDKANIRGREMNGEHHYNGCYSSGTESYMLDNSTIIFYTVDKDYVGDMWKAPKSRRCTFHVSEDGNSFIQGRLYPDGRDGGETGMAAQFRNIFQKVWSEAQNESNLWKLSKGAGACCRASESYGTHYRDYENYEDCVLCVRKNDGKPQIIRIGHRPMCPACGSLHTNQECILCEDCAGANEDYITCERCGAVVDTEGVGVCANGRNVVLLL